MDDIELVRSVLLHPDVYPWISDDGSPVAAESKMPEVLLGSDENFVLSPHSTVVMVFVRRNRIEYEIHTNIIPEGRGRKSFPRVASTLDWMLDYTPCRKFTTSVPTFNRAANWYARKFGMTQEGVNRQSFLKNGELYDQILFGLTREEWICR
jgi:hypothetical protein